MKRYSAQYIITNSGPRLKRAIITTDDNGTIISVEDTGGHLEEKHSVEFFNGIIIPGFVNCHCHLELSHMKDSISPKGGLGGFIQKVRSSRENISKNIFTSATSADNEMFKSGVVLCADICNTSVTFDIKNSSRIKYLNLLEVFGIDPAKASNRMEDIMRVAEDAKKLNLPYSLVPHSVYSMSKSLFRLLRSNNDNNTVTSIHFMETSGEKEFLENHSGPLMTSYEQSGLIPQRMETVTSNSDAVLNEVTSSGNLMLVHNTFADRQTINLIRERNNLFWCLCPNSNIYIENTIPPVKLLLEEGCEIVIGTDSLASNTRLDILSELITLQTHFPDLSVEDLIAWATINGARALGEDTNFGKIEPGKNPGLLVLQNVDLVNMKLLPESFVTRLT